MTPRWLDARRERGADLDDEIASHLAMAVADRVARGETREHADAAARREFGNVAHVKEVTRDMWGGARTERLVQDVTYAVRSLRRAPAFTAVAVLTLALGIGANTAMFTVLNGVLVRPLPFSEPDRVVLLRYSPPPNPFMNVPGMFDWSYDDFRTRDRIFQSTAAFNQRESTLAGADEPVRVATGTVTGAFFATLGVHAALGRTIIPGDDGAGQPDVVVLGDRLWRSSFGAKPNVVGQTVRLDGMPHTVIGVLPPGFDFPYESQLWVPMLLRANPGFTRLRPIVARLAPGATLERSAREFAALAPQLALHPNTDRATLVPELLPVKRIVVGDAERPLVVLAAAVGLVLLIACGNVANLLLMRAAAREHEIAVRRALGAGRARLVRQLLTESVVLALAGGVAGLAVAWVTVRWLVLLAPAGRIPRIDQIHLDGTVLAFALGLSLLTGLAFGLAPALAATRTSLRDTLSHGARAIGRGHGRLRAALVIGEIALALVLSTGAGLMIRSLQQLRGVRLGFHPAQVLTTTLSLDDPRYRDIARLHDIDRRTIERLASVPGVAAAGIINYRPLGHGLMASDFAIDGGPALSPDYTADRLAVGGDYFAAMGIAVRGRGFTAGDDAHAPRVVVVSRAVAAQFWPGADPIGRRITFSDPSANEWTTIVGVADDVVQRGVTTPPDAAVYEPYAQVETPGFLGQMSIVVRTAGRPQLVAKAIREAVREVDPTLAVPAVAAMDDLVSATTGDSRFLARLLGAFSALALVLAAVGIYGVLAYGVSERSREIGVRMALGATSNDIVRLVGRGTLWLIVPGLLLGTLASVAATRVIATLLFGVTPTDPAVFAGVVLVLAVVGLAASALPARRASRVDPLAALR